MANILNKKKLISLENYVFFLPKNRKKLMHTPGKLMNSEKVRFAVLSNLYKMRIRLNQLKITNELEGIRLSPVAELINSRE